MVEVCQPHLHRASIAVYFRTGSRYETVELNGISHFLEHMIFRGTETFPTAYELNLAVESLGGTLFAATAADSTEFEISLPKESLIDGAKLLANVLTKPLFKDMHIERRVIAEEIREDLDENLKPIDIDFLSRARLWPTHPLGQSVIGPLDNILKFTKSDIRRHFEKSYVANNAVVCISGAFDSRTLSSVVDEAFSAIRAGGPIPLTSPPERSTGPTVLHSHHPGSQTQVRVAFHAPGDDDPDNPALMILLSVLDDGMSTRLHRRIFDELGLAYNVSAGVDSYHDAAAFNIDASTSHENVVEIVSRILQLIEELRENPASPQELQKAKRRAAWAMEEILDDPHDISGWYGEQDLYRRPSTLAERTRELIAVELEDLERVARRVFDARNLHITTVGVLDDRARGELEAFASRFMQ